MITQDTKVKITNGDDLRRERLARGLSQVDLATKVGLSTATISRYELGDSPMSNRVCQILSRTLDEIPKSAYSYKLTIDGNIQKGFVDESVLDFNITTARQRCGLSLRNLSKQTGISHSVLHDMEHGRSLTPERIIKIRQVLFGKKITNPEKSATPEDPVNATVLKITAVLRNLADKGLVEWYEDGTLKLTKKAIALLEGQQ